MKNHSGTAEPAPTSPEQLRQVRYTLPPQCEDATVFYKTTVSKALFTVNGPPQWGTVRMGVDKMQSLKKFAPHDLAPISTELIYEPGDEKNEDLRFHIQGYRLLDLKVVDWKPSHNLPQFHRFLLDDVVGDYLGFSSLMKAAVKGSNAKETELEIAKQLSFAVMTRWLVARKRWLVQTPEWARSDQPPHLMLLYPDSDFKHSHDVPPQPPYQPHQSVSEFFQAHDLSTCVQEACLAAGYSASTRRGVQQCFGQNAGATLVSRQFHPMDVTNVCLRMGLPAKDISFSKWRSQVDAFVQKIISPNNTEFQRPLVLAHLWMNPYHRNLEFGQTLSFETCLHTLFQLAWLQPTSIRFDLYKRFVTGLKKKQQKSQKRKRKSDLEITLLQDQIDRLEAVEKSSWLEFIRCYTYRLAPSQLRNSFYMRGKAILYLCPPLRGLAWARRDCFDCNIPPVVVDSPYILTVPLAHAALLEGTQLFSRGYTLLDPSTGDHLLRVSSETNLTVSCRPLLMDVLETWNQWVRLKQTVSMPSRLNFASRLLRVTTAYNFPVADVFVSIHYLLKHSSVLDTIRFFSLTLAEAADCEHAQVRSCFYSLEVSALLDQFKPQPFETKDGVAALHQLYANVVKWPSVLPAKCVTVARPPQRSSEQPDEFEGETDSSDEERPAKKHKVEAGGVAARGLKASVLEHKVSVNAKRLMPFVPSRQCQEEVYALCQEAFQTGETPAVHPKQLKKIQKVSRAAFYLSLPMQGSVQRFDTLTHLLRFVAAFKRMQAYQITAYCRHFYLWEGPLYHFRLKTESPVIGSTWYNLYHSTHNRRVVDAFIDLVTAGVERAFATVVATNGIDSISMEDLPQAQSRKVTGCLTLLENKGSVLSEMAFRTLTDETS